MFDYEDPSPKFKAMPAKFHQRGAKRHIGDAPRDDPAHVDERNEKKVVVSAEIYKCVYHTHPTWSGLTVYAGNGV